MKFAVLDWGQQSKTHSASAKTAKFCKQLKEICCGPWGRIPNYY